MFEGNIHTENHNGNTITESSKDTFKYVDDVMRREVDKVIAGWGLSEVGDAKQTLTKALSTNMTWEEVERVFMQSDFWKRDGEPNLHTDSFTAHDGHVPLLNRVKIVFSQRVSSSARLFRMTYANHSRIVEKEPCRQENW